MMPVMSDGCDGDGCFYGDAPVWASMMPVISDGCDSRLLMEMDWLMVLQ